MNTHIKWIIITCIACGFLVSCSDEPRREKESPYPPGYFEEKFAGLNQMDVAGDVINAVAKGDHRFIMNVGFGCTIPGVTNSIPEIKEKYGIRILDGTGDIIFGAKHREFKKDANEYAKKYNQLLLQQIIGENTN